MNNNNIEPFVRLVLDRAKRLPVGLVLEIVRSLRPDNMSVEDYEEYPQFKLGEMVRNHTILGLNAASEPAASFNEIVYFASHFYDKPLLCGPSGRMESTETTLLTWLRSRTFRSFTAWMLLSSSSSEWELWTKRKPCLWSASISPVLTLSAWMPLLRLVSASGRCRRSRASVRRNECSKRWTSCMAVIRTRMTLTALKTAKGRWIHHSRCCAPGPLARIHGTCCPGLEQLAFIMSFIAPAWKINPGRPLDGGCCDEKLGR